METLNMPMISSFMCQLGQVAMPRYLVKHCPGWFCEGDFLEEINIYIVELWANQGAIHNMGGVHPISWKS